MQNNPSNLTAIRGVKLPRFPAMLILGTVLSLSAVAANAGGYSYQTIDNAGDPNFNQLLGINDSGVIAGYFGDGSVVPNNGYTLTAPYGPANYSLENFPASAQTQVTGINNPGETVGFYIDGVGNQHGFYNIGGVFHSVDNPASLPAPTGGVTTNQLLAVNNAGMAAGFYVSPSSGNTFGETYDTLNNTFHAVNLGNGAIDVTAAAINDAGIVGGFYTNGATNSTGYILNGSVLTLVQDPLGVSTQVLGLNNKGLADGDYVDSAGNMHGFIYNLVSGQYATVDDPFAANGTTLNGLNDNNQLTGFYVDGNNITHGLLVSIPEPAMLYLLLFGMPLLASRRQS